MSAPDSPLLRALVKLAEDDVALLRIKAERGKIETGLSEKMNRYRAQDLERQKRKKALDEKRTMFEKEERRLRDERTKLIERRKALSTLGAYKLQQAATKEIEYTAHELDQQEEKLLAVTTEIETLEAGFNAILASITEIKAEIDAAAREAKETFVTMDERSARHVTSRTETAATVAPKDLVLYNRTLDKFPLNPVVPVISMGCSGCFMQLGPQVTVQLMRGLELVRCPGCARLLYMTPEEQPKPSA